MLSKQTVLRSVETLLQQDGINVSWDNQILEDGVVISSTSHRCSYTRDQKNQLLAEVDGAEKYISIMGW